VPDMLPDPPMARFGRRLLKRILYSLFTLRDAVLILFGRSEPSLPFTVKGDPCSVYFNFRIKATELGAFTRYINIPREFRLAPMQCVADEEPQLLLTLNVYEVTGLALGIRAEWSTYIYDAQGVARYMVLEAQSSEYSMDPIDIITPKGRVEHCMTETQLDTVVASLEGKLFESTVHFSDDQRLVRISGDWIAANDFIYWRNGLCDRTFYDENMVNAQVRSVPPAAFSIRDNTHWATFIEPEPVHVLRYEGPLNFMITAWVNI
jgi:hypothetical protein